MKNLAICIPTFNRCEVVKDTFDKELDLCQKLGIDIYLYDSSNDGQTKKMVYSDSMKKYDNLFYIALDPTITLDEKVVKLFQGYGRTESYEYIWLSGDSVAFSERLMKKMLNAIKTSPSMIFVDKDKEPDLPEKEYNDIGNAFRELFWKSPFWGSVAIKEALYRDVNWDEYIKKFVGTDQISVGLHWYCLATVYPFRAVLIKGSKGIDVQKSAMKKLAWWKENSCGSETVYRVWAKGLYDVMKELPYSEEDKKIAIDNHKKYGDIFSWKGLCRSRKDGVFTEALFEKYKKELIYVSSCSETAMRSIVKTPIILMKIIVRILDLLKIG